MAKVERVACYIRVSSEEQVMHGISLAAQEEKLRNYADNNHMLIVEWYKDEGVSGRKEIKKRPELQRMISDAEQGKFDRIIFVKLDRFFRSVAEYYECMKRIDPVTWTTTEEKYDLTTANGRFFVNAKLAVAEMEADQTGERIKMVNDHKVTTGQPLHGRMPFCYMIDTNPATGRKRIVKNPKTAEITEDMIEHFQMHQSIHKTVLYINAKYGTSFLYKTISALIKNPLLCGEFRGNPKYIEEPYIDKETFERMQKMIKRNTKTNTVERDYIFGGLIKCENCGAALRGTTNHNKTKYGTFIYKMYRCGRFRTNRACDYNKSVYEGTVERLMLENVELYLESAKIQATRILESNAFTMPRESIDDINAEIDRLNYSWQTGKIRSVELYEKQYSALMERLEKVKAMQDKQDTKDFSKIEKILCDGWKEIYNALDDAHKRAFWRSFVESIEIDWKSKDKKIKNIVFF